jgi:hypothetical protein
MGWVTDVAFVDGVELNGTKIVAGMSTQVRWDFGVGSLRIDKEGKIMPEVWHGYPLCLQEKEDYQKELETFTGAMDTNMGTLFFNQGQLCHLDLSYENVGEWVVNNIQVPWNESDKNGLYRTLTPEQWARTDSALNLYRATLLSTDKIDEEEKGGYALTLARKAYVERSGELVDPFYKAPTPNGFITA